MFILAAKFCRFFMFPSISMHPRIAGIIFYHISQDAKNKYINKYIGYVQIINFSIIFLITIVFVILKHCDT